MTLALSSQGAYARFLEDVRGEDVRQEMQALAKSPTSHMTRHHFEDANANTPASTAEQTARRLELAPGLERIVPGEVSQPDPSSTSDLSNLIDTLPSELITHIGFLVLATPTPLSFATLIHPLALLAVSPRWRSIFSSNPAFWSLLHANLTCSAAEETLQVEVSGDGYRCAVGPEGMRVFLDRVLGCVKGGGQVREWMWEGTFEAGAGAGKARGGWFNTGLSRQARYQRIALRAYSHVSTLCEGATSAPDLSSVTRLAVRHSHPSTPASTSFATLLNHTVLPNLEELVLQACSAPFSSSDSPLTIHLPNLKTIILSEISSHPPHKTRFILPRLETVGWNDGDPSAFFSLLFPSSDDAGSNTYNLTHFAPPSTFSLSSTNLPPFLTQLSACPSLESLDLTASDLTDPFLDALCWPFDSDRPGLCPEMETLVLSDNPALTGAAVVRLVASRMRGAERGECARIRTLHVEDIGKEERGLRGEGGMDVREWVEEMVGVGAVEW